MPQTTKKIILILLVVFLVTPLFALAQDTKEGVKYIPISGSEVSTELGIGDEIPDLKTFINKIFQIGIRIAGVLAVLIVIFGGIQYMTTDAFQSKSEGKERIKRAMLGLGIALSSILILNTINPRITDFTFELDGVEVKGDGFKIDFKFLEEYDKISDIMRERVTQEEYDKLNSEERLALLNQSHPTGEIVTLDPSITVSPSSKNKVDSRLASKLKVLHNNLKISGINWRITEAYPPTTKRHKAPCHYDGTCVDANFTGGTPASVENVRKFIDIAKSLGLKPVYEVRSESEEKKYEDAGIPSESVISLGSHITGNHFSVYDL
jgi:hypothetical protein